MQGVPLWMLITMCAGALLIAAMAIVIVLIKNGKNDLYINKNGVIVKASSPKTITTKQFVNFMKEVITYVEDEKEDYVDDVIGIKNRFYKQSKDFAKSRIESVKNQIIEEYKIAYMAKYNGRIHPTILKDNNLVIETSTPLPKANQLEDNLDTSDVNACHKICSGGCNSGLSFFDSRIQKDFKPILEDVYRIIEENHLINRSDREYEEEITVKAGQLASFLKNTVISYPVPIDNSIAIDIINKRTPDVKEAIADSLRRSRTLSQTKREAIAKEKERYYRKRDTQIAQIVNILNDDDLCAILKRTDRRSSDVSDDMSISNTRS